ncbi:SUR7/PalI family domain containing protein [Naviculisporaceae sp. PSN 640]
MNPQLFKFAALGQAAVAFIFILVALTGGQKPNYLENVHIIRFNMSEIGQNLVPDPVPQNNPVPSGKDCGGGILGKVCDVGGDAIDKVQDTAGDVVDKVSEFAKDKLNIKDYYSVHLTDLCLGDFNAEGDPLIDSCTTPFMTEDINVLKQLTDQVKSVGIDLEKLGFVKELNDAFDKIPKVLSTTGYFFTAIAVLLGLCILTAAGAAFLASGLGRTLSLVAIGLAGLTWLLVLIGVLIITVVAVSVSNTVNEKGNKIGVYASVGGVLMFLVWMGLILITGVLGTLVLCLGKKDGAPSRALDDNEMYATKEIGPESPARSREFNPEHVYGQEQHQEGRQGDGYEMNHPSPYHGESDVGEAAKYYHPEDDHQEQFYSPKQSPQGPRGPQVEPQPYDNRYSVAPSVQGQEYNPRKSYAPNAR